MTGSVGMGRHPSHRCNEEAGVALCRGCGLTRSCQPPGVIKLVVGAPQRGSHDLGLSSRTEDLPARARAEGWRAREQASHTGSSAPAPTW